LFFLISHIFYFLCLFLFQVTLHNYVTVYKLSSVLIFRSFNDVSVNRSHSTQQQNEQWIMTMHAEGMLVSKSCNKIQMCVICRLCYDSVFRALWTKWDTNTNIYNEMEITVEWSGPYEWYMPVKSQENLNHGSCCPTTTLNGYFLNASQQY
jgi:hypothetical protein